MTGSSELNRERWYATAVIAIAGFAWIAGSHYPDLRLWGFNHLAFLPTAARAALGIALAAALMIVWSVPLDPAVKSSAAGGKANPLTPVVIVGWMMLAILIQAATPLLGDGYLRGDEIGRTTTVSFGVTEYLPGWLASEIQQGMRSKMNLAGVDILAGLSAAAGVIFAVGLVVLWPRALTQETRPSGKHTPNRLLSALWLLTAGSSVMFFGYVESYGLALAFLMLFTLAILAHRNGLLGWRWPVVLWVAAVWSHLSALGWAPALLYAMYQRRQRSQSFVLPLTGALVAIGGTLAVMHWFVPASPTTVWTDHFLPVFTGAYSMLHWRHWIDAANHLILLLPVSLLLIRKPRKGKEKRQSFPWATVLLWGPTVFALITFNPKLGWWRDWDLFALLSAPAIVVLAVTLAQRQLTWSLPRRVAAVSLAVLSLTLWTWVNADEDASAARFESLLVLDPDRALSGYENLGRYWREKGNWEQSVRVLGTALAMKGHQRLFTQRGIGFSALGMPDSGLVAFQKAIAADSTNADGYFGCGQMLWLLNRSAEALPYLRRAVDMESTRVMYRYQLGQVLRGVGDFQAALPHFAYASEMVKSQPEYANMYAATLFDAGEADSAITVLRTLINRHPAFALAYSNLAWIRYQQGDIPGAEAALSEYERRTRPEERVASTNPLRQAIDSVRATGSIGTE